MSELNTAEERLRIEMAESVTIPRANYIAILDEIDALRAKAESYSKNKGRYETWDYGTKINHD